MKVLIVEDEPLLARQLRNMVAEIDASLNDIHITHSVHGSVQFLQTTPPPDLILMDIELEDGQSFDIFQQVTVTAPVIFITAYDEFALKAFKLNSIDYLLKPVNRGELKIAIDKFRNASVRRLVADQIDRLFHEINKLQQLSAQYKERFLIKTGTKMISIDAVSIAYLFSEGGISYARTFADQKYILDHSLDDLEQMLNPRLFFRANRKYLLAHLSITAIHAWFNQKLKVDVKPATDEPVIISREKSTAFKRWLGE